MLTIMAPSAEVLHVGDLDINVQVSQRHKSIGLAVGRDATLAAVIPPGTDEVDLLPRGYHSVSCTPDGKLNVHWATMRVPPDLIDYVLVHELTHLHHPDHSVDFWHSVEHARTYYQVRRDRIRRQDPDLWPLSTAS